MRHFSKHFRLIDGDNGAGLLAGRAAGAGFVNFAVTSSSQGFETPLEELANSFVGHRSRERAVVKMKLTQRNEVPDLGRDRSRQASVLQVQGFQAR